jgi:hypothetical protein
MQRAERLRRVYQEWNWRGDYGEAVVHGAPRFDEIESPLTLREIQERFPELAAAAGMPRIRRI